MFVWLFVLTCRIRMNIRSSCHLTFLSTALMVAVGVSIADAAACRQTIEEALRERAARLRTAAEPPPGHPERMMPDAALSDAERRHEAELRPHWRGSA